MLQYTQELELFWPFLLEKNMTTSPGMINGSRNLGDWEYNKFRADSNDRPAVAVVAPDVTQTNSTSGLDELRVSNVDTNGNSINPATEDTLTRVKNSIDAIRSTIGTASDLRTTILSGTITTVTTVTGITNIGGNPAIMLVPNAQNTTYILTNQANIA